MSLNAHLSIRKFRNGLGKVSCIANKFLCEKQVYVTTHTFYESTHVDNFERL